MERYADNRSYNRKQRSCELKGFEKALTVTLTFDPRSRFSQVAHLFDRMNNQAEFHRNPIIDSKVMARKELG